MKTPKTILVFFGKPRNPKFSHLELFHHAEGDGTTAGLSIVQLALNQEGLNSGFGKRVRCAPSGRAASDDCNRAQ